MRITFLIFALTIVLTACGGNSEKNVTALTVLQTTATLDLNQPQQYAIITARATNAQGEPLVNASVQFSTTLGSFSAQAQQLSTTMTTSRGTAQGEGRGEAQVKLYPGSVAGTAEITAFSNGQRQSVQVSIIPATDVSPARVVSMRVSLSQTNLTVKDVGQAETALINIELLNINGERIAQPPASPDVHLRFLTRPGSSEALQHSQFSVVMPSQTGIDLVSSNGLAQAIINTGELPGVIQLEASYLPSVQTANPIRVITSNITVSSGPAETITVAYPTNQAITNLGNGFYRRQLGMQVTDRYGNAVADGTAISLGALDTVLTSNLAPVIDYGFARTKVATAAQMAANSATFIDAENTLFLSAFVQQDQLQRVIKPNDRLLILNAPAADKHRFIADIENDRITVNQVFKTGLSAANYLVGAAVRGIQIAGDDSLGQLTIGRAEVRQGLANVYLTYPADRKTLQLGCLPSNIDERVYPRGTAQVWIIAQVNNTSAITLDNGACFSAVAPYQLVLNNAGTAINQSRTLELEVRDANNQLLPYTEIHAEVSYANPQSGFDVRVGDCAGRADRRADINGKCNLPITLNGGTSGDSATVQLRAPSSAVLTISVAVP